MPVAATDRNGQYFHELKTSRKPSRFTQHKKRLAQAKSCARHKKF
jgi:hypothetical protein